MEIKNLVVILVTLVGLVSVCEGANNSLVIGVILHDDDYDTKVALTYAVKKINMFNTDFIHGQKRHKPLTFLIDIRTVSKHDSFKIGKVACDMLASGVAAIFGPTTLPPIGIVQSTCSGFEVPHIQAVWNPSNEGLAAGTAINVHPDVRAQAMALAHLVKSTHWKSYGILYQDDEGLVKLQEVLKINRKEGGVVVRQIGEGPNYRPLLKEMKNSSIYNIIIDCETDLLVPILTQAREVGFLHEYQSYILTSLDAHTVDFGNLFEHHPNITTIRLIDPSNLEVQQAVSDWSMWEERETGKRLQLEPKSLLVKTALMYDALHLFTAAVKDVYSTYKRPIRMEKFDCDDEHMTNWEHGLGIVEYMKIKHTPGGLTGPLKFDGTGRRTDFELQVVELSFANVTVTGSISALEGFKSLRSESELQMQLETSFQNKVFVVSSRIGAPYLMHRIPKNGEVLTGNDRYEGYSMDLIDAISKIRNFTYIFELAPDGRYGSINKNTKEWDGLIKQLLLRKADLAICDLTITYDRRTAVDFTMPFMTLGISILYSKSVKEPPNLFSFTSPLSTDVWLYMATAFLGVTFLMYVLARMSPSDWENPHPCDQNPEELENAWDFKNCLWFTLGGIMAQGCDILPKAISTRMLSGMWWFFSLILLSSYTAKLAAFLTKEQMGPSIESADDLAKQSKIKYGAVDGGSTLEFFKKSNFSTYQRMWAAMDSARPRAFPNSNQEGVERVLKEKKGYAFLMESTSIEYEVAKNCELRQVGGLLDSKGYGIAMPLNSPYRSGITWAVLQLQQDGVLHILKEKWWKQKQATRCEITESEPENSGELDLDNVGGVFVVLFVGMGIAFFIAILEFLWNVRKVAVDEQMTLFDALVVELKFAFNIFVTKKSAKPKMSEPSTDSGSETRSIAQSVLRQAGSFLHLNVFNEKQQSH